MSPAGPSVVPAGSPPPMFRIERLCLALPETTGKISHGAPSYQVRGKGFAHCWNDHHGSGRLELWVKAAPGVQQEWAAAEPDRYYRPPYVGPAGWVGAWLDGDVDWPAVIELLVEGYLDRIGPRAAARLDGPALVGGLRQLAG